MAVTLDEKLEIAIRTANRYKMAAFMDLLAEHKKHAAFRTHGWVFNRELGFVCCGREFRTSIRSLTEALPEARKAFTRIYERQVNADAAKRKRAARKADKKAKALLFRFLTREQKWSLRASNGFEVQGQDGLTYRIVCGQQGGNAVLCGSLSYCFHAKDVELPLYDLVLAQKLYIETRTADFLAEAHVRDSEAGSTVPRVTDPASIPEWATASPETFLVAALGTP
jgi:hypothetical protein